MAERIVSRSRVINAPPEAIFGIVASPSGHARIDGSGSVRSPVRGPDRLEMGSKFRMDMKMGVPYRISSKVVEFEENRLIAWAHLGKHRWRFELEPVEGGTRVTHSFDWSTARSPKMIELAGFPKKHPDAMERTLERLDEVVTSQT
jgi:uncharacterized protein YndB with AHSA1/START domain